MQKTALLIGCILMHSWSISAMEAPLAPWVKKATTIHVNTIKTSFSLPIQDSTTLLDIKRALQQDEGIPTDQQALYPLYRSPKTLWLMQHRGNKLTSDSERIKSIMHHNNSNTLALFLSLRNH